MVMVLMESLEPSAMVLLRGTLTASAEENKSRTTIFVKGEKEKCISL